MKVVLWGLSSPKFVEAVASEMHGRLKKAELSIQIAENAQSVQFCGVQPEEFLRLSEGSLSELSGIISRVHHNGCVLVLDCWSLILLPDFVGFLTGVLELSSKLKGVVLVGPEVRTEEWATASADVMGVSGSSMQVLIRRALAALELALNSKGTTVYLQTKPSLEHVEYLSGRKALGALQRFGLHWAPKAVFREQYSFVSKEALASAVTNIVVGISSGEKPKWRQNVRADISMDPSRFLNADVGEWAPLARLAQLPVSWDVWCSASPWPGVRIEEAPKSAFRAGLGVAWMCSLGLVENQKKHSCAPMESAFRS